MRSLATIAFVFTCLCSSSQTLLSKVYTTENVAITKTASTFSYRLFYGSGAILSTHEMYVVSLFAGKTATYKESASGNELFFIVKTGPVAVTLNGAVSILDRGSVIVVLPGDKVSIENKGKGAAEFYQMVYHSIAAPDKARGEKAGPSFVMNWNDMFLNRMTKAVYASCLTGRPKC